MIDAVALGVCTVGVAVLTVIAMALCAMVTHVQTLATHLCTIAAYADAQIELNKTTAEAMRRAIEGGVSEAMRAAMGDRERVRQ